jgi:hypothetical protein
MYSADVVGGLTLSDNRFVWFTQCCSRGYPDSGFGMAGGMLAKREKDDKQAR